MAANVAVHVMQESQKEAQAAVHVRRQRLLKCMHCWQLHRDRAVRLRVCIENVVLRVRSWTLHSYCSSWRLYVRQRRYFHPVLSPLETSIHA